MMDQQQDPNTQWHTCCSGTTERGFVKFIVQVAFAVLVSIFAMTMIVIGGEENREVYFIMLSTTVGIFLPTPSLSSSQLIQPPLAATPRPSFLDVPKVEEPVRSL